MLHTVYAQPFFRHTRPTGSGQDRPGSPRITYRRALRRQRTRKRVGATIRQRCDAAVRGHNTCVRDRRRPPALLGSRRATTTRGCATSRRSRFATATIGAIRRRYLPPDYRADAAPIRVDKTVYVETEWDPARPGRRDALRRRAAPRIRTADRRRRAGVARRAPMRRTCSRSRRRLRSCAACATSRAPIARPTDVVARRHDGSRSGARATRSSRRNGLRFDLQTPWWHLARGGAARDATFRTRRSSSITPACRPTAAPKASPAGSARWTTLAACPNVAVKISGLGQRGQPWTVGRQPRHRAARRSISSAPSRCMFASNFPGRQPVRDLPHDLRRLPRDRARLLGRRAARAVPRQRHSHLRDGSDDAMAAASASAMSASA